MSLFIMQLNDDHDKNTELKSTLEHDAKIAVSLCHISPGCGV